MKFHLEKYLWENIDPPNKHARCVIEEMINKGMIQSPKEAWRTLEKWTLQQKWNYGSTLDLGWKQVETLSKDKHD